MVELRVIEICNIWPHDDVNFFTFFLITFLLEVWILSFLESVKFALFITFVFHLLFRLK